MVRFLLLGAEASKNIECSSQGIMAEGRIIF